MDYPLSVQSFEELRTNNYIYIDKTKLVYELAHEFKYVFLSRPRRFGKSLLLSTLGSYFKGKSELFDGLAISELEKDWIKYPVFVLDLVHGLFNSTDNFYKHIDCQISNYEEFYGTDPKEQLLSDRFAGVIKRAYEKEKLPVIILIDEYDKPLLDTIGESELQKNLRDELRSLYGVLKSKGEYIKFAMFTGVSKFGQLNVFSGLNNLSDITFYKKYATICGITQEEINFYFEERLYQMAQSMDITLDQMKEDLRLMYDGYRFTKSDIKVFNPFSLLNALKRDELGYFWFDSGNLNYLMKLLTINHYNLSSIDESSADESQLSKIDTTDSSDPLPILYQSGYLTIKEYNSKRDRFYLGFPNKEVRKGFLEHIFPYYSKTRTNKTFNVNRFVDYLLDGKPKDFMDLLVSLTANISYEILADCEESFQNILFIIFTLSSITPLVERRTSDGRIDMVVETDDYVYLFEFKINSTAQEALDQINSKEYSLPWKMDNRKLFKIGANFSTSKRRLTNYKIE